MRQHHLTCKLNKERERTKNDGRENDEDGPRFL